MNNELRLKKNGKIFFEVIKAQITLNMSQVKTKTFERKQLPNKHEYHYVNRVHKH